MLKEPFQKAVTQEINFKRAKGLARHKYAKDVLRTGNSMYKETELRKS